MVIHLSSELSEHLSVAASKQGTTPEQLATQILEEKLSAVETSQAHDTWEETILGVASDCGVSLSNDAVSSEGIYP